MLFNVEKPEIGPAAGKNVSLSLSLRLLCVCLLSMRRRNLCLMYTYSGSNGNVLLALLAHLKPGTEQSSPAPSS